MKKRNISLSIILALNAFICWGADQSIVFQQGKNGYQGCEDTFIVESDDLKENNYGGAAWGMSTYRAWQFNRYILIKFKDIIGSAVNQIPPGSRVKSAKLELYVYQAGSAGLNLSAHELLVDCVYGSQDGEIAANDACSWVYKIANEERWNFNMSDGPVAKADYFDSPAGTYQESSHSGGWKIINITSLVNNYSCGKKIKGVLLKDEASFSLTYFRTSEYSDADYRPKLTVIYDPEDIQTYTYADGDADGLLYHEEVTLGTNPNMTDTDGDTIPDHIDSEPLIAQYLLPENQDADQFLVGALIGLRYNYDLGANYYGFNFEEIDGVINKSGIDYINWTDNAEDTYKRGLRLAARLYSGSLRAHIKAQIPAAVRMVDPLGNIVLSSWGYPAYPFTYPLYQQLKSDYPSWGEPSELMAVNIPQIPVMWLIANEPGEGMPLNSDYSIWSKEDFRVWCQNKYSTISAMNTELNTNFIDWNDIEPPVITDSNKRLWLTWQYYRQDMANSNMKLCSDAIKALDTYNRPISVKETPEWHRSGIGPTATCFEKTANLTTAFGVDSYPADPRWILKDLDLSRSLSGGQDVWIGETGAGSSPEIITQTAWAAVTRNIKAINFFLFIDSVWAEHHSMFKGGDGKIPKEGGFAVAQFAFETKRIGDLLKKAQFPAPKVALYYPEEVFLIHQGVSDSTNPTASRRYYHDITGILYALYDSGYQVDFITPEQIKNGKLNDYQVLYLASAIDIDNIVSYTIENWVHANGGSLFADALAMRYNKYHEESASKWWFLPSLRTSLSMQVNNSLTMNSVVPDLPSITLSTLDYTGKQPLQTICRESYSLLYNSIKTALARYSDDNSVAAYKQNFGTGEMIVVGSDIGRAYSTKEGYIENDQNQKNIAEFISYAARNVVPETVVLSAAEPERIVKGTLRSPEADLVVLVNRARMITLYNDKRGDSNGGLSPLENITLKTKFSGTLRGLYTIDDNSRKLTQIPYSRSGDWVTYSISSISIAKIIIFARDYKPVIGLSFNKKTFLRGEVIQATVTVDNLSSQTVSGPVTLSSKLWAENPQFQVNNLQPGGHFEQVINIDLSTIKLRSEWGRITPYGLREIIRVRGNFNGNISYPAIDDIFIK